MSSINILKLFYAKLCIISLGIKEVVKISVVDDCMMTHLDQGWQGCAQSQLILQSASQISLQEFKNRKEIKVKVFLPQGTT